MQNPTNNDAITLWLGSQDPPDARVINWGGFQPPKPRQIFGPMACPWITRVSSICNQTSKGFILCPTSPTHFIYVCSYLESCQVTWEYEAVMFFETVGRETWNRRFHFCYCGSDISRNIHKVCWGSLDKKEGSGALQWWLNISSSEHHEKLNFLMSRIIITK